MEDTLKLKIERLVSHQNLPNCKPNDHRRTRGQGTELWLVEDDPAFINPESIIGHVIVWLCDLPKPAEHRYFVKEILYRLYGRWKYRDISKRHLLPSEYT
jgi:hypothetical protein